MDIQRRDFIKLLGGTTIATALPGCTRRRPRNLIPYIIPHEEIRPGKAVWYASVCRECPAGCGIHVRVREGRAVKVEGNPVHPVNQGKLCSRGHASLQGLYNPDRIQQPLRRTEEGRWQRLSWDDAEELVADRIRTAMNEGAGDSVAMIGSYQTGSLDGLIGEFLSVIGSNRRLQYEPFGYESLRVAGRTVFGLDKVPRYSIAGARYIASFGSDFLETWMSPVRHAREFGATRELVDNRMVPFLHVGPRLSMTATNADEFIQVKPGQEYAVALGMVHVIVHENLARTVPRAQINQIRAVVEDHFPREVEKLTGIPHRKIERLARMFAEAEPGAAIAGTPMLDGSNGALTASAVHLLNYVCGNVGRTVFFDEGDRYERVASYADMHRFIRSMEQGEVSVLFIHETNPSFTMPRVSGFNAAMQKIPLTVALTSYMDETAARADVILPVNTPLESWGDYEPEDGVYGLMQPSMRPVFNTRMAGDVLLSLRQKVLRADERQSYHDYIREQWQAHRRRFAPNADFEEFWIESLANGGRFADTRPVPVTLNPRLAKQTLTDLNERAEIEAERSGFELVTYPSLNHYDGRGANRPWLQEIPDPMTQMTWENWAEIHPDDAGRIGVRTGDKVELRSRHGYIELPAYVYEGVPRGVIAVPVGQGHTEYGRYAENNGANPIALLPPRPSDATGSMVWSGIPVTVVNKQERLRIANAAGSDYQHGRPFLQVVTVEELIRNSAKKEKDELPQIYEAHEHPDHRWGMTIDLNKCIGCSACVTACYSENNIPVVGKEDVRRGRELSWLQVQRFFDAREDASNGRFLPMLCQHCDNAPCEPVCPVFAAYHTPEGLNAQVYNRCIGTRYCANNCPYKVRRFNWWDYDFPSPLNWQLNPDVTVRSKGVMEKCTFCVQRITGARQQARLAGREIRDGDVVTACQQSCPTDAIVFGDLKDPESRVNRMRNRNRPRGYRVLEELNTQPAVVYLKDMVERTL
jgi:anaerobic selenocysteine-containing dehydrogenase/Fe-S-cluster-containing dehydrogenase component